MLEQIFNDDALLNLMPTPEEFFANEFPTEENPLADTLKRGDQGEYGIDLAWLETPGEWGRTYGFRLERKLDLRYRKWFKLVVQQDEYSDWCAYMEVDIASQKGRSKVIARVELCRCTKRGSNDPGQRKGLRRDWFKALSHEVNSMIEKDQLEPQWD
jgi:hypothetical protein